MIKTAAQLKKALALPGRVVQALTPPTGNARPKWIISGTDERVSDALVHRMVNHEKSLLEVVSHDIAGRDHAYRLK